MLRIVSLIHPVSSLAPALASVALLAVTDSNSSDSHGVVADLLAQPTTSNVVLTSARQVADVLALCGWRELCW